MIRSSAKPREMDHDQRTRTGKFDRKITVRNGVETICRNTVKSEFACNGLAIDRKAGTCQSTRTERHNIDAFSCVREPFAVTL